MNKIFLFAIALLLLSSCGKEFSVEGTVDASYNGRSVYLYIASGIGADTPPTLIAQTKIENGTFLFANLDKNEKLDASNTPTVAYIFMYDIFTSSGDDSSPRATVILEEGDVKVVFEKTSVTLSRTPRNQQFNQMHQALTELAEFSRKINLKTNSQEDLDTLPVDEQGKDGRAQFQEINTKLETATYQIVKENMSNNVGQFLFLRSYNDNIFTPAQMHELIELGTDEFRQNPNIRALKSKLDEGLTK